MDAELERNRSSGDRCGTRAKSPRPPILRALDVLKSAKKPLIILARRGYAQADDAIRGLSRKRVPFLPMSMAKGLLPDTHPQCAGAARSNGAQDADVVMLIGARLTGCCRTARARAG